MNEVINDIVTTYEVDLKVTDAELRDLSDALVLAVGANIRVLEHLQAMDTESSQRGATETIGILGRRTRLKNQCGTLLAAFPDEAAGWRAVINNL